MQKSLISCQESLTYLASILNGLCMNYNNLVLGPHDNFQEQVKEKKFQNEEGPCKPTQIKDTCVDQV